MNGRIHSSIRLSAALRYFAGACPIDIALVHGISHVEVFRSVWKVVDAINACPSLNIAYPTSHRQQKRIAREFELKSGAKFANCAGAIDGILIWTSKPMKADCDASDIGAKKFLCSRKHKFGLNMQATCDANGKFLDISICHPGATSDYLAFVTSFFHSQLEQPGFMAPGLAIYGDNAYVNCRYMVTPFKAANSGYRDDYNYYQSQLRISIECAFGMLVHRWAILRKPMPIGLSLSKVTAMTASLCKLHNFCINQEGGLLSGKTASRGLASDEMNVQLHGGVSMATDVNGNIMEQGLMHDQYLQSGNGPLPEIVGGGHHRDDHTLPFPTTLPTPRDECVRLIREGQFCRPRPIEWQGRPSRQNLSL
jgi:hypothetical protein